jgi:CO dehydrogenase maturation factor
LTKFLVGDGREVLAIDSDHNMDLTALLGADFGAETPTFHRLHDEFREVVGLDEDRKRSRIALNPEFHREFHRRPSDGYTARLTQKLGENLELAVVGLGSDDVVYSQRCAHGHSAPLLYYLPMLTLRENQAVVIDGVAGVDMLNFGLYLGADLVVVVVEPQKNSIRVAEQIEKILEETGMPHGFVVNKSLQNSWRAEISEKFGEKILGEVPVDSSLMEYDAEISGALQQNLSKILGKIPTRLGTESGMERLQRFWVRMARPETGK